MAISSMYVNSYAADHISKFKFAPVNKVMRSPTSEDINAEAHSKLDCFVHVGSANPSSTHHKNAQGEKLNFSLTKPGSIDEKFEEFTYYVGFRYGVIVQTQIFNQKTGDMTSFDFPDENARKEATTWMQNLKTGNYVSLKCQVSSK